MDEKLDEIKEVDLSDGLKACLLEEEHQLCILLHDSRAEISRFRMAWPKSGYGGGTLARSPSGKYLIFSYFSGQSEEAFILFEVENALTEIFNLGYQFGEVASFGFNKDESTLVMALPYSCCEWWQPLEDGDAEILENGDRRVAFGALNVLDIDSNKIYRCEIRVDCSAGFQPEIKDYEPYIRPKLNKENTLALTMPWGVELVSFPLDKQIILLLPKGFKYA